MCSRAQTKARHHGNQDKRDCIGEKFLPRTSQSTEYGRGEKAAEGSHAHPALAGDGGGKRPTDSVDAAYEHRDGVEREGLTAIGHHHRSGAEGKDTPANRSPGHPQCSVSGCLNAPAVAAQQISERRREAEPGDWKRKMRRGQCRAKDSLRPRPDHQTGQREPTAGGDEVIPTTEWCLPGGLGQIECNVEAGYGYEVDVKMTGESGAVQTNSRQSAFVSQANQRGQWVEEDWLQRFDTAYIIEARAWVNALQQGQATGPSAWDGYTAMIVADACIESAKSGHAVAVAIPETPAIYSSKS